MQKHKLKENKNVTKLLFLNNIKNKWKQVNN